MSSDQPYNSLGQILSNGGEIALGLAIAYDWSDAKIAALFARRFEPMDPQDRQRLVDLAHAAVAAGQAANELEQGQEMNIADIPVNPYLFGDEPGGQRSLWIGRFQIEPGGKWYEVRRGEADVPSLWDLINSLRQEARGRIKSSPKGFGVSDSDPLENLTIDVQFVERRF